MSLPPCVAAIFCTVGGPGGNDLDELFLVIVGIPRSHTHTLATLFQREGLFGVYGRRGLGTASPQP
jgi:hypothetical protein